MKFCHVLETTSREVAEYRTLFLFYKFMKKQLKRLPAAASSAGTDAVLAAEHRFVDALVSQIATLNAFRMDRQTTSARTLADLQAALNNNSSSEEKQRIYQALVNFHGEALLLMHWSILAYTAIVKLLKKHQKHTGILVQAPHLRDLLSQSSWSTEVVTSQISQAEACINQIQAELFGSGVQLMQGGSSSGTGGDEVAGPRRTLSSNTIDNEVLLSTLASLANGEDSGEDSPGMQDAPSEEDDGDDAETTSVGSTTYRQPGNGLGGGGAGQDQGSAAPLHSTGTDEAGPSAATDPQAEPFVNHALLQQMEVALKTWEYLQEHASTPSTVLRPS